MRRALATRAIAVVTGAISSVAAVLGVAGKLRVLVEGGVAGIAHTFASVCVFLDADCFWYS